jgi:hypothetical protein
VLRLIDLLAVAEEDKRQGGDPRLPLELALVKVTRPHADLQRESLAHRVELLETRAHALGPHTPAPRAEPVGDGATTTVAADPVPEAPAPENPPSSPLALEQVSEAWQRTIVEAVRDRSISVASLLTEAKPIGLSEDTLTVEFPPGNDFHRKQLDEPKNIGLLRDALYEVTGRRLSVVLEAGHAEASAADDEDEEPQSEEDWIESLKQNLDAREVEPDE